MKGIKARYAYNEIIFYIKYIRKSQQNKYKGNKRKNIYNIYNNIYNNSYLSGLYNTKFIIGSLSNIITLWPMTSNTRANTDIFQSKEKYLWRKVLIQYSIGLLSNSLIRTWHILIRHLRSSMCLPTFDQLIQKDQVSGYRHTAVSTQWRAFCPLYIQTWQTSRLFNKFFWIICPEVIYVAL